MFHYLVNTSIVAQELGRGGGGGGFFFVGAAVHFLHHIRVKKCVMLKVVTRAFQVCTHVHEYVIVIHIFEVDSIKYSLLSIILEHT